MGRLAETARWKRCVPRARLPIYAHASFNSEASMENENAVARPGNWVRNLFKVNENAAAKPRTWVRRLVKIVAYVSVALVALYVVASAAWRYSGSNNWEFTEERNGVKVYTLKSPGSDLTQVKGIAQ